MSHTEKNLSVHLPELEKLQLGSFYTPTVLVDEVSSLLRPYIERNKENAIIFDNASGCGAFIDVIGNLDYRFADCDKYACNSLKLRLNPEKIFQGNSLVNVNREKYDIPLDSFLIQVGNPPYNDTTSEYKNGEKGRNECDVDLFDRDLGVSFLKSFNKLRSDVVCVLHPLSYLIKESNFNRLKEFRENYSLKSAVVFPSSMFEGTGGTKFPIIIGLYERKPGGMNYELIKNFEFPVLGTNKTFKLNDFKTTDGFINKYPPRKYEQKISSLNLYFYTFRDINSLRRNTSFLDSKIPNGIVVEIETLYKYAYLYAFKKFFRPVDIWLYGNLSPLIDNDLLERNKTLYVDYAIRTNLVIQKINRDKLDDIYKYYKVFTNQSMSLKEIEAKINSQIVDLTFQPSPLGEIFSLNQSNGTKQLFR